MTVRLSLLAILDQGSCYGYQLRTELDRRTGLTGPINVGQIYNTLDRLERDKLVRKAGEQNYYEITDAGRAEVVRWFANPSPLTELPAKIALAASLPGVDAVAIIRLQRAGTANAAFQSSDVAQPGSTEAGAQSILAAAAEESRAGELRFLAEAERLIAAGIPKLPLSTETPKRGRPAKVVLPA